MKNNNSHGLADYHRQNYICHTSRCLSMSLPQSTESMHIGSLNFAPGGNANGLWYEYIPYNIAKKRPERKTVYAGNTIFSLLWC